MPMSMLSDAENTLAVDRVHGTDETAKILNVSKKTLRRLELRGVFGPRIQITERIHGFRDSTINQYLTSRTAPK
jgi:predicted DNA-binding transcriptional regulator AlpA